MQLHVIPYENITVAKNRQRREFDAQALTQLAASIADNGLIHPLVIRKDDDGELVLVAGERRLRALEYVWNFGQEVRCGEKVIPEQHVPCLYLGEIDPVDAFEIELEENVRRTDLSWQDKITAENQLLELRRLQAEKAGLPAPTTVDLALELNGSAEPGKGMNSSAVRMDILLAKNLSDPDIARAKSRDEAEKIFRRKEEQKLNEELGIRVGATFSASDHTLLQGDCLEIMKTLPAESFDVILTDPPYGISADEFGDSGGRTAGAHGYDDSYETWLGLISKFVVEAFRVAKPQSHAYVFCDIDNFVILRTVMQGASWTCFRTPLVWVNPTAMRAPWIESGPQRKWQMILYAKKGDRRVTQLFPDVITCASDTNLGHQAQKPVAIYSDLLRRSVHPGDSVLDPFAGSGPIFPAAHWLKCRATGIELDPGAIGIASRRLGELK